MVDNMTPKEKLQLHLQKRQAQLGKPLIPNMPEYADMIVNSLPDASDMTIALMGPGMSVEEMCNLRTEFRPLAAEVLSEAGVCECGTKRTKKLRRCPKCGLRWPASLPRPPK